MSVWAYCDNCKEGMDGPTLADCAAGEMECDHCSHPNYIDPWHRRLAFESLTERIEKIEAALGIT